MGAMELLLKLRSYELACKLDAYTPEDSEHDQLVVESYFVKVERVKGGTKNAKQRGRA